MVNKDFHHRYAIDCSCNRIQYTSVDVNVRRRNNQLSTGDNRQSRDPPGVLISCATQSLLANCQSSSTVVVIWSIKQWNRTVPYHSSAHPHVLQQTAVLRSLHNPPFTRCLHFSLLVNLAVIYPLGNCCKTFEQIGKNWWNFAETYIRL